MAVLTAGCSASEPIEADKFSHGSATIADRLSCLQSGSALVAAHRGTSGNLPENSLSALEALLDEGIQIIEVDVSQLSDGTAVLFHDGVWDDKTNGQGAVAATDWARAQTFSLRDRRGRLSKDGVIELSNYLRAVGGHASLEIDFKTSADYEEVIDILRREGALENVILISYSEEAAKKLRRLAPDTHISVPSDVAQRIKPPVLTFGGRNPKPSNLPSIALAFGDGAAPAMSLGGKSDIVVSDNALDIGPLIGTQSAESYFTCLRSL